MGLFKRNRYEEYSDPGEERYYRSVELIKDLPKKEFELYLEMLRDIWAGFDKSRKIETVTDVKPFITHSGEGKTNSREER